LIVEQYLLVRRIGSSYDVDTSGLSTVSIYGSYQCKPVYWYQMNSASYTLVGLEIRTGKVTHRFSHRA